MGRLIGLDRFQTTASGLRRLGQQAVGVRVSLRAFEVTPAVTRLVPEDRHPFLRRQAKGWVAQLAVRYPAAGWKLVSEARGVPMALVGRVAAAQAAALALLPGVESVAITRIPGRRRGRWSGASPMAWFCVRGLVAIQVEGQLNGMQTVEDRFMLVRAASAADATRRLKSIWRDYAKPYLNSSGHMVRWQLESISDVYEAVEEEELNPRGAEVYSALRQRRLRPELAWLRPRKGRPTRR